MTGREPFARDEGRHVFEKAAATYAAARPDYPERVYDILRGGRVERQMVTPIYTAHR